MQLASIGTLRAGQITFFADGSGGRLFVLQPGAGRSLTAIDPTGALAATTVTTARIAKALAADSAIFSDRQLSIRAMAAIGGGDLLLYAAGTSGRKSLASLWLYRPASDRLTLAADSAELADASGLGDSIDLADAQLVQCDGGTWLYLDQGDAAAFLFIPDHDSAARDATSPVLRRAFNQLRRNGLSFRPIPGDRLFARDDGGLGLLRTDGGVYAISPDGEVSKTADIDAGESHRPALSAPPLTLSRDAAGKATRLEFRPDQPAAIDPLVPPPPVIAEATVQYPAISLITPTGTTVVDRDNITVRRGFPVHALRITAWYADPASGNVTAYDALSGEIMRLAIERKDP